MHERRQTRRRMIQLLVAGVVLLSLSLGATSVAAGGCPPAFTHHVGFSDRDRDGDGHSCFKLVKGGTRIILIDDR